ncbi:MAG: hypothetical protein D6753_16350 [Planctomycetota bacterium]|nr:MAG: hypothetical protein D6753_16350 [Planctomycetota bacterium]
MIRRRSLRRRTSRESVRHAPETLVPLAYNGSASKTALPRVSIAGGSVHWGRTEHARRAARSH